MRYLILIILSVVLVAVYQWGHEVGYTYGVERCWDDVEGQQP